uniref:putative disease resistance RPP13-like protein 1 n=1 Tax=Erigeron canadensis TaxID=72917 RepID=UPI001CB90E30|nr:putative disease resistance RPP13-like protein 1 [Erigeron canadensis]
MVASVMNSVQPYKLGILSDDIALSLLAQYALEEENFNKHPLLESIGQGIVKKCDGLPLALLTLGRVLKTKGIDDVKWDELLKSEIWSSEDDGSDILPALKLSYYHLPSHIKQVFAYCSMFPKDYDFEKNKLILLWMAQGFLSQTKGKNQPMESLGCKYFEELVARSFFQPLGNDESRYKMHDLINDLATSVAGEFFFRLDKNMDLNRNNDAYEKFRHFSFIRQQPVSKDKKYKELHKTRCLRTFLLVSGGWGGLENIGSVLTLENVTAELLPRLHFLRVLSLTNYSITMVPHSIGCLKHLRYLNFSETEIPQIPEEVSKLYNLQSLLVRGCGNLFTMPVSFVKLINLRHLDMTHTPSLKKLPLGIGGLTSLQTLFKVVIQDNNGLKISELRGLKDLQGVLSIEGLEKAIDPTEAKDAELHQKKGLDELTLTWGDAAINEHDVIEKLRPHSKLKTLCLDGYRGMKFPSWLGDPSFDGSTELVLNECNCVVLPTLEHLTSLRKLGIYRCSKLESIEGRKEVVNGGSSIMGSLRQVNVIGCDALESYYCPSSVESLVIWGCHSMKSLSFSKLHEEDLPSSSNLKNLEVKDCKDIKSYLLSLTSLEEMFIWTCPSMEDLYPSCGGLWPPNLRELSIGELKKPMSKWGLQNYPSSLVRLVLYGSNSGVVSFGTEEQDYNNTRSSCFLLPPSLTYLDIIDFEEVESVLEVLQNLPHLEELHISGCPKLKHVPKTSSSLRVYVCGRNIDTS